MAVVESAVKDALAHESAVLAQGLSRERPGYLR